MLMALASIGLISTPVSATLDGAWTEADPMGGARAQAVVVQDADGLVYVIGGVSEIVYSVLGNVSTYDPESGAWEELTALPIPVRGASGAVGPDGRVYVFGGETGSGIIADVQIYDPDLDVWGSGTDMMQGVWQGRAAVGFDGRIYICGGLTAAWASISAVQIYDPVLDSWSAGSAMPGARNAGALVCSNDAFAMMYIGGSANTWIDAVTDVYYYYVPGDFWYSMDDLPVPLTGHAAAWASEGNIYVVGGGAEGYNQEVSYNSTYMYSIGEGEWHSGPDMPVELRHTTALSTPDGRIFVYGGNNDTAVADNVLMLEIAWSEVSISADSVPQGANLDLNVALDFAFFSAEAYYVSAYILSDSDVVYLSWEYYVPTNSPACLQLEIPETVPIGHYTLVVAELSAWSMWNTAYFPSVQFELTILDSYTVEEQIAMLEANVTALEEALQAQLDAQAIDIAALQTQIDALSAELAALTNDVDDMDSALADRMDGLEAQLDALDDAMAALQAELDGMSSDLDDVQASVDNKMDGALGLAIIGLLIVVILLMVVMMLIGRKPKSMESQPPEPPLE
jgi:N-acetylneuraminic acid mutarotase